MRTILFAVVAATTACAAEGTPRADTTSGNTRDEGAAVTRVQSKDGTQIAFTKGGKGPALVMVSGALSQRTLKGDTLLVPRLMEHFTVYTYDRRGRGES